MDAKRYSDFIKFEGSIITYSLVEDTFDDEAITIEIVLDAPVKQLNLVVDAAFLQNLDLIGSVPPQRVFQDPLSFFPRKSPLRFDHDQRFLAPTHVLYRLPKTVGYRLTT